MSTFITGLGLLLVNLPLIISIDGPYTFSALLKSATDIEQSDIMLVDTMCLKFFNVSIPTFL